MHKSKQNTRAKATKILKATAPIIAMLKNLLVNRCTPQIKAMVPEYILKASADAKLDMETTNELWTSVVNGDHSKVDPSACLDTVLAVAKKYDATAKSLATMIDVAGENLKQVSLGSVSQF